MEPKNEFYDVKNSESHDWKLCSPMSEPVLPPSPPPSSLSPTTNQSKKQLVFNLVESIVKKPPQRCDKPPKIVSNVRNSEQSKPDADRKRTNNEIYYFDHGNAAYYKIDDEKPLTFSAYAATKTERLTWRFWGDVFGALHIAFMFVVAFFHQLLKFIFYSILQQIIIKPIQIASDNFLKPLLITFFNDLVQPPLILCYNIITSIRDLSYPIAETIGYFLREIANVVNSCRPIQINSCAASTSTMSTDDVNNSPKTPTTTTNDLLTIHEKSKIVHI